MERKFRETHVNGIPTVIQEVGKFELGPLFGNAHVIKSKHGQIGKIKIREGLPPSIRRFIEEHEKYHIKDWESKSSWIMSEMKANMAAGLKEPVGFLHTTYLTISDSRRRNYYLKKLFNR